MLRNTDLEKWGGSVPIHGAGRLFASSVEPRGPVEEDFSGGLGPTLLVETAEGPVPAQDIRAGMRVLTLHHGLRQVVWCGLERRLHAVESHMSPVRLAPDALGRAAADGPRLLAPGQKLRLRHPRNRVLFAHEDVVARAGDLVHLPGVRRASGRYAVTWVHILFDGLEMLRADGLWLESMRPNMQALRARHSAMARAIEAAVPGLRFDRGLAAFAREMTLLNADEVRLLRAQDLRG